MSRRPALGNIFQSVVFAGLAAWLQKSWPVAGGVAGLCAGLQIGIAVLVVARRKPAWVRRLAALTVLGSAALLGFYLQVAWHVSTSFGASARSIGLQQLGVVLLALPWIVAFPLWQALARPAAVAALLLGLAGPLAWRVAIDQPVQTWPAQPELAAAAEAAYQRWRGADVALPTGVGPALVLVTPWRDGQPGRTTTGEGDDLAAALRQASAGLGSWQEGAVLVVDLARARLRPGHLLPAGEGGALTEGSGVSPAVAWEHGGVQRFEFAPLVWAPRIDAEGDPTRFDSVQAGADGAVSLQAGWAVAPPLTAAAALDAAVAGARMLASTQNEQGRYAYVLDPDGRKGSSYNLPRHAGVTWYLARVAARTGDAALARAADRGLDFMDASTIELSGGRAMVVDKRRKDGAAWVGTTALAALAATTRGRPEPGWRAALVDSVTEEGRVRGELDRETEVFRSRKQNPYGQGQVTLALAALVRAGDDEARPALERAARYLDGDYAPGPAGHLVVLDEHWMCLAALATREVLGEAHGSGICRGYLGLRSAETPRYPGTLQPETGPAGGLAEAVVAGAFLGLPGDHHDDALSFGRLFVEHSIRPEDAPRIPRADLLIGGFRSRPWDLEVRMDSVQHIGCALLGIEALLSGRVQAGSLP